MQRLAHGLQLPHRDQLDGPGRDAHPDPAPAHLLSRDATHRSGQALVAVAERVALDVADRRGVADTQDVQIVPGPVGPIGEVDLLNPVLRA